MEIKYCEECQRQIRGRSDKRFCDDNCRNAFNNRKNSRQNSFLRIINRKLRKNRNILQQHIGQEKMVKVNKFKLLTEGLEMDYHTHLIQNHKGQIYYFNYEYGYLEIENDNLLLVRNLKTSANILSD